VKRYRTEIVAENAIILDRAGGPSSGGAFVPAAPPPVDDSSVDPSAEIKVEDIPF
jgi:hypothetical protein